MFELRQQKVHSRLYIESMYVIQPFMERHRCSSFIAFVFNLHVYFPIWKLQIHKHHKTQPNRTKLKLTAKHNIYLFYVVYIERFFNID